MSCNIYSFIKRRQIILIAGDIIAILGALFISELYYHVNSGLVSFMFLTFFTTLFGIFILDQYNLYNLLTFYSQSEQSVSNIYTLKTHQTALLTIVLVNTCIIIAYHVYVHNGIMLSRVALYVITISICLITWRCIASNYLIKKWKPVRLAIIAPEQVIQSIESGLKNIPLLSISTQIFTNTGDNSNTNGQHQTAYALEENRINDFVGKEDFDILAFYSSSGFLSSSEIEELLKLPTAGKQVCDLFGLYESLTGKVPLRMVDGQWLLQRSEFQDTVTKSYARIKRVLDVVVSALALALLAPLMALTCLAVKGGSRGPAFFAQDRLGQYFKTFRCYKFRTMIDGAEDKSGPVWASRNDPRVTTVGRFLRRSRLDELPQLWNVLKGDMTLVGPRPIRESYARELEKHIPFYRLRFCVKPGLTGWAQVNYDYAGSMEGQFEKFQYELFYIKNMSLVLDWLILFKTVKTAIRQRGT